jgi:hypothetical protein
LGHLAEPLLSLRFCRTGNIGGSEARHFRHVLAYDSGGVPSAYGARRGDEIWLDVPDVASFHLPAGGAFLTALAEESVDSEAVLDAYYGTALPLVIQATRGLEVLHGSAVFVPSQASVVAFCGTSGAGKSTVGYGLAARGYSHWADDAVAFRVDGMRSLTSVGLPFTVKVREGSGAYFRTSSDVHEVVEKFGWKLARLGGVFVLQPLEGTGSGERIAVERLAPGEALRALLPNAFRFQPQRRERKRETMRSYLELVASIPILTARFPHDLDRLPDLLDEFEQRIHEVVE